MTNLKNAATEKPTLIYVGIDSWYSIHQRPQHLARCLSAYFRVLYVDPSCYTLLGYIRNRMLGDKTRNLKSVVEQIQDDLYLFRPNPLLPFPLKGKWWNEQILRALSSTLLGVMAQLNIQKPILVLSWPLDFPLAGTLGESLLCYDCMDHYAAFALHDQERAALVSRYEQALVGRANVIFASSRAIQERLHDHRHIVHIVRNAVSSSFLDYKSGEKGSVAPADWPAGDGPVIGYIGMIAEWFDMLAVTELARRNPTWRFVIIGPSSLDLSRYASIPNLHFLGSKAHSDLPNYVSRFDVGLIPFVLNELTLEVNPVKVYEYFALGIPVVSSRLPELAEYEGLVKLAGNTEEFVELTEKSVQEQMETGCDSDNHKVASKKRREIACANTWKMRAQSIKELIDLYTG